MLTAGLRLCRPGLKVKLDSSQPPTARRPKLLLKLQVSLPRRIPLPARPVSTCPVSSPSPDNNQGPECRCRRRRMPWLQSKHRSVAAL